MEDIHDPRQHFTTLPFSLLHLSILKSVYYSMEFIKIYLLTLLFYLSDEVVSGDMRWSSFTAFYFTPV